MMEKACGLETASFPDLSQMISSTPTAVSPVPQPSIQCRSQCDHTEKEQVCYAGSDDA